MTVEDVAFETHGGVTLRGVLHLPSAAEAVPGVVMAHGFSAVKEMGLTPYAESFRAAGMAVLVHDHRNFGASDGTPRQEINPWAQARDYRSALTWMGDRPEVDSDRLGLWGSSFSGGEVIVVGACDDRVGAVVANVPFAGLAAADDDDPGNARFEALRAAFLDDSGHGLADGPGEVMGPMPVVTEGGGGEVGFLGEPESAAWFLEAGGGPGSSWRNEVTLANAFGTDPAFDPGVCVAHVAPTPLLIVAATEDRVAPVEIARAAYARAGEPKRLEMIEGNHYAPYSGLGSAQAVAAARAFLVEALDADRARPG
jgi:cephalosporin-C deacetylase-like acetyl esterase